MNRVFGWRGPGPTDWTKPTYKVTAPTQVKFVDRLSIARPIRDQLDEGACTGFGTTGVIETVLKCEPLAPQFVYFNARVPEATQDVDAGAYIADAVAGVGLYGAPKETVYPYVTKEFAQRPTYEAYTDGMHLKEKLQAPQRILSLPQFKHALASGFPVVFGFSVPEYFMSDEVANTGWVRVPVNSDRMIGGHCVFADGFDDRSSKPFVWCVNSWSAAWGIRGWFKMDQRWFTDPRRLWDDAWCFLPV